MNSGRFAVCFTILCLGYSVAPSRASADWIHANFDAAYSYTTSDTSCPGTAHSRDTYNGSGTATLNWDPVFNDSGPSYAARIMYSSCNGLGTWVTGGLFTVTSGAKGSFSGRFDGNYLPAYGNYEYGEYLITSETGVFSDVDLAGWFDMSPPPNHGGQSVLMYTPEPQSITLAGFGIVLLGLLALRRKSRRQFRPAACV